MTEKLNLNWWAESCDIETDADSGAQIRMLTSAPALTDDIYCEQPYCSADGNRLALHRKHDPDPTVPGGLMIYEIGTYRIAKAQRHVTGIANAAYSGVLFVTVGEGADKRLVRIDLNTLERTELFAWGDIPTAAISSVSADDRYGIGQVRLDVQRWGAVRVDLTNGKWEMIHDGEFICNQHLQFRLYSGARILVQENRGCLFDADGLRVRPFDERGTGLYSIAADGTDRRDFPVSHPHTPGTTGHECWIGDTDHVLVTLQATWSDGEKTGNVLEVSHDWPQPRVVFETPKVWNHISVTKCGRYFITDSYQLPRVPILVGSIKTGKTRVLCHSKTSGGGAQYSHAHPYITSDNRWAVFNSDRTGLAQVYIASISEEFLSSLDG
jgi:hypothetical protein